LPQFLLRKTCDTKMNKQTKQKLGNVFAVAAAKEGRPGLSRRALKREREQKGSTVHSAPSHPRDIARKVRDLMKMGKSEVKLDMKEGKDGMLVTAVPTGVSVSRDYARTLIGVKPYRVNATQEFTASTGTANAAYTTAYPADYTLSYQYTSMLNLFDEVRCIEFEARFIAVSASTTGGPNQTLPNAVYSVAFDPDDGTASSGNDENLSSSRHVGPIPVCFNTGTTISATQMLSSGISVMPSGHISLKSGKLVSSVLPTSSGGVLSPNPVQGAWVPTTTASAVAGYVKFYAPALGANMTLSTKVFIIYTLEFRMRG